MIKTISLAENKIPFRASDNADETKLLPDNISTRVNQTIQKTESAFIDYPVKGLKGDVNSNFYQFLTMGIVPYLVGSGMLMFAFNAVKSNLSEKAQLRGKKMALGVVLYGIFKTLSKDLITQPVKWSTGVNTEAPYQNKVYSLPTGPAKNAEIETQHEQRKVYDSKEFFRKDLLDKSYFDKIAIKLGLGENLNDSVTETSPIIQNIISTSNIAKSISSYAWAAVGGAIAMQDCWKEFFHSISHKYKSNDFFKNIVVNSTNLTKSFTKTFIKAWSELWQGPANTSGFMKHAGKGLLGITSLLTIGLTANVIIRAHNMAKNSNIKTIDDNKESTVI